MKILQNILSIVILASLFSCDKEKEDLNSLVNSGLNGKWNLISVSCECAPVDLEKGQQIWYIDTVKSKLTVENNVIEDLHTILETGEYSITIDHTNSKIEILSTNYDYWIRESDLYVADKPWVDGPLIKLVRD